ncbi:uncharacterized protein LOC116845377 [Odontomachus brunneus]|uniref:uncharacterized protein LOC116845377 n=1 Tax=Odontomachus brunneus TaxID=486640 RepID=UPI0013F24FC9|nr:uncharacterized protein LOC116845377 [Odontomachus brunneus]
MDKDIIVTCPYNKAHRIRKFKLMTHLMKCKKQHDTQDKVLCPLDSGHVVDHNAVKDHLSSCSNLSYLIDTNNVEEKIDVASSMNADTYTSVENWNDMPEVPTYDAMTNAASRKVIRCVNGLTKSERQKFRMNEQDRFKKLNDVNPTFERSRTSRTKEMIRKMAMHPLYDITEVENSIKVSQKIPNKSTQEQDSNANSTNEFRDIFQKTLYDELLPDYKPDESWKDSKFIINESKHVKSKDCVKINTQQKLTECFLADNDTSYKSFNDPGPSGISLKRESRKEKSLLLVDQNQEAKNKEEQENVTEGSSVFDTFSVNTSKREIECTANTHDVNTSSERVTDKLLNLLMEKTEKIELAEKTKENDKNNEKDENDKNKEKDKKYENKNPCLVWENMICKLSDRLDDLTNAQTIAAEQSALLAKEVSDLKQMKRCCNTQLPGMLNSRCAANFTERVSPLHPTHTKNHNVSQEAPTSLGNAPNSYNANRDDDIFNLRDNSKLPELKTPKDFSHC